MLRIFQKILLSNKTKVVDNEFGTYREKSNPCTVLVEKTEGNKTLEICRHRSGR